MVAPEHYFRKTPARFVLVSNSYCGVWTISTQQKLLEELFRIYNYYYNTYNNKSSFTGCWNIIYNNISLNIKLIKHIKT